MFWNGCAASTVPTRRKGPCATRRAGFEHLSLDLIYGVPVGGVDRWARDLDLACALRPTT